MRTNEITPALGSPAVRRTLLADVVPKPISWLWPGRIAAGSLVTIDGESGLGKSVLALDVAANVTRAGQWPDGTWCEEPGDVAIISADGSLAEVLRPRLDAANADVARVHFVDLGLNDAEDPMSVILGAVDEVERQVCQIGASLLIVDVTPDPSKGQQFRKPLTHLAKLADRTGCTVLLLRHLATGRGGEGVYRGGNSTGVVGAHRIGYLVTRDPDRPEDVRLLAPVKNLLARPPSSLAFRLAGRLVHAVEAPGVEWLGEDDRTATDLLVASKDCLGEPARRIEDFVNSQPETTIADTAEEFAIDKKLAGQYLRRLYNRGSIRKKSRGVYQPTQWAGSVGTAEELTEASEVSEVSEGNAAFDDVDDNRVAYVVEAEHVSVGRSSDRDPNRLHPPGRTTLGIGESDSRAPTAACATCGSPLGESTGKCGTCILDRARAAANILPPVGATAG